LKRFIKTQKSQKVSLQAIDLLIALENTIIGNMKVTDLCSKNIIGLYYAKHHFIAKTGDKNSFIVVRVITENRMLDKE
jgi:hypothetical protein